MVLVLSDDNVRDVLELAELVDVVEETLIKQAAGEVERPERPHFPVGTGLDGDEPAGTGLAMPAHIHGDEQYATKLVGVHEGNAERGLPTIHAQVVLTDARTGVPEAFLAGRTITNARTGCIGATAVRALAPDATTLGVLGAGAQARWQTRAVDTVCALAEVRIHSPSDSRGRCAADLRRNGIPAEAVDSPAAAVEGADVVVTATTASEPVFPPDALAPGALVVAVGAFDEETQELHPAVVEEAAAVFADVPAEVAETGDFLDTGLGAADLAPLGTALSRGYDRDSPEAALVVASVGSAALDAAASTTVYRRARENEIGTDVPL
ncbi:MAG: putative ornithine cyclodeaminase [uncultured archaeon A07HR67]|jgi:Predicted ornithine cyclodeaminase, mu-crystallin homolog|nr:MAG: putative ornithine cyclodeaminase [uncultured archaeon A07HR67]